MKSSTATRFTFDELDLALLHGFQIDGRVPFSRLAAVLGVSEQTVARRYRRLVGQGGMRVLGVADEARLGYTRWLVRMRCAPQTAESLAGALAGRTDTFWVGLMSGGTEVTCVMRARTPQERETLLLEKLRRTPGIASVSAHCLLHIFYGGAPGWFTKFEVLRPDQADALCPAPVCEPSPVPVVLDAVDEALVAVLGRDGRATYAELRQATHQSESAVRRRLENLLRSGAVYLDVQLDPGMLGYDCRCTLWLTVTPSSLATVGAALAGHREVAFAAATSGASNVVAAVVCRDTAHLYRYLTERIGALEGVQQVETAPVLRHAKYLVSNDQR
jgi:DNA-binding Lrp family transcriptional regulator